MTSGVANASEPWVHRAGGWVRSPLARAAGAWVLVFVVLVLVQWRHHDMPFYWDSLGYVYPHAKEIYDSGLFPILRDWDVGHPTAFFFTLAVAMKGFGVTPLAGHVVVWGFAALLVVAFYGLCRVLELPKVVAAACSLAFLLFPLIWAMSQQILLDLPLLAMTLAAYWFWARNRRIGYLVAGGYGVLIKLHGVLLVSGPVLAVLITHGQFWRRKRRGAFLRDLAWSVSPALVLLAFLAVRFWVRGPGMTIDWVSGNRLIPVWRFGDWIAYVPAAWIVLFSSAMIDRVLGAAVVVWVALGILVTVRRRCHGNGRDSDSRKISATADSGMIPDNASLSMDASSRTRLMWALVFLAAVNTAAFFQSGSLCARYNLPTLASLALLTAAGLWRLIPRIVPQAGLYGVLAVLFMILWHPKYGERLPPPLSSWLTRKPNDSGWGFENDLRVHDVIHQIIWAHKKVLDDAEMNGCPVRIAAPWPFYLAYALPRLGYVKEGVETRQIDSWEQLEQMEAGEGKEKVKSKGVKVDEGEGASAREVEGEDGWYVVLMKPITLFLGPPPSEEFDWRNVAVHRRHEVVVEVWHVRRQPGETGAEEGGVRERTAEMKPR